MLRYADYEKIFNSYSDTLKTKLDYIEMSGLSVCDKLPEEDEIFSFTAIETFQLVETDKGYKIVSV